jgi:hypothetical protein
VAITWADVLAIASELSVITSPATQNAILATARVMLDPDVWGDLFDEGHKYLAAHDAKKLVQSQTMGGAVGAVSKYKVGPIEVSYQNPTAMTASSNDTNLSSTNYGQIYLRMRRTRIKARVPFVAT